MQQEQLDRFETLLLALMERFEQESNDREKLQRKVDELVAKDHAREKENGAADVVAALNTLIASKMPENLQIASVDDMYRKRDAEIYRMIKAHSKKFLWKPNYTLASDITIMKGTHGGKPIYPVHSAFCNILDALGVSGDLLKRLDAVRLRRHGNVHWAALLDDGDFAVNLVKFQAKYLKIQTKMAFDADVERVIEVLSANVEDLKA